MPHEIITVYRSSAIGHARSPTAGSLGIQGWLTERRWLLQAKYERKVAWERGWSALLQRKMQRRAAEVESLPRSTATRLGFP